MVMLSPWQQDSNYDPDLETAAILLPQPPKRWEREYVHCLLVYLLSVSKIYLSIYLVICQVC